MCLRPDLSGSGLFYSTSLKQHSDASVINVSSPCGKKIKNQKSKKKIKRGLLPPEISEVFLNIWHWIKNDCPATLVSPPPPGRLCRIIHLYLRRSLSVSEKHNVAFYGLRSAKPHSVRMTNLLLSPANHFTSGKQQGWGLRNSRSLPFLNIKHGGFFFLVFFTHSISQV